MPSDREELQGIAADLRGHLLWLQENGAREVPRAPAGAPRVSRPGPADVESGAVAPAEKQLSLRAAVRAAVAAPLPGRPPAAAAAAAAAAPVRPQASPVAAVPPASPVAAAPGPSSAVAGGATPVASSPARTLEEIRNELGDCRRCKLAARRKHLVFGVGASRAELVFVGEGPGAEEDEQGIPFVGAAGQLLTRMIEAMGFTREQVYICNVVKCRPPGNRNPEPDEIAACEPFLQAQLASLGPKVIVTLGKFAAQTLLRDSTPITRLRGKWREYCGIRLMPTFHPAYLLRQPSEKKLVWDDLQQVMKVFGREPPARR